MQKVALRGVDIKAGKFNPFFSKNRCMKVCVKILIGSKTVQKNEKSVPQKNPRKLRRDGMRVNRFILFYL